MTVEDLENCIAIDEDACVTGESTDSELVLQAKRMRGQDDEEEDEDLEDSTPSNIDIMNALKIVRKFAQINTLNNEVNSLSKIETTLMNSIINSKKQTEITHYFK